jgi:hypothetical protein
MFNYQRVLVAGLKHDWIIFHFVYGILWVGIILPIDGLIFFKMVKITNQLIIVF